MVRAILCLACAPVLALGLYLLAAIAGGVLPGATVATRPGGDHQVGLIAGPIHYDFLLPVTPDLRQRFAFAAADGVALGAPDAEWLAVGWGAHDFYTTVGTYRDLNLRAVASGILGDGSVMRLFRYRSPQPLRGGGVSDPL